MEQSTAIIVSAVLSAIVASFTTMFVEQVLLKYRLRTEEEFRNLKNLWSRAYWLKSRANSLRPTFDSQDANVPGERERRLHLLGVAVQEFKEEMYLNKPFYPKKIYDILDTLRVEAHMEGYDYRNTSPDRAGQRYMANYWDKAEENQARINKLIARLESAIRQRTGELQLGVE